MARAVEFTIVEGDIITFAADVVALKFAKTSHGADEAVANELLKNGQSKLLDYSPKLGEHDIFNSESSTIASPRVLFYGVGRLVAFGYAEIESFVGKVFDILAAELPNTKHIAMTCHGVGYGLDEEAAIWAQVRGIFLSVERGGAALEKVTIVERDAKRAERLREYIDRARPQDQFPNVKVQFPNASPTSETWGYVITRYTGQATEEAASGTAPELERGAALATPVLEKADPLFTPGREAPKKRHAFVAMPFKAEMDDVFFYGIQQPIHRLGMLCERADFEQYTGDVMAYVRERIETAAVVIADLTGANPNVYLEVGYAWGRNQPTILVVNNERELKFDVQGQRCLVYPSIRKLEELLEKELQGLITKGVVRVL
jgi:hypothetical protein